MLLQKQDEQLSLFKAQEFAFDEMNLVELPIALLTDSKNATNKLVKSVDLAPGGFETLESLGRESLPTAMADRVVLGLLWLTKQENGFSSPTIRFSLRKLIQNYMYPNRTKESRISGDFAKRVEEEIHRIAWTRIHTRRWFDKELGRETQMDAAIIDYIQVIDEGGRNRPRMIEMKWGEKLFRSVQAKYTKEIDVATVLSIDKPLDLRFYRWLDRQLSTKDRQFLKSCQQFAKYKLLMRGQKIDAGGRTASSYIANKLKESLHRLENIGFGVKMTIDQSCDDYSIEFVRQKKQTKEVFEDNPAGDLIAEFLYWSLGIAKTKKQRIGNVDREYATQWITLYKFEKSIWMVKRCVELHRQAPEKYSRTPLRHFRALEFYEPQASEEYDKRLNKKSGNTLLYKQQDLDEKWNQYCLEQIQIAQAQISSDQMDALQKEAENNVKKQNHPKSLENFAIQAELNSLLLHQIGAKDKDMFLKKLCLGKQT